MKKMHFLLFILIASSSVKAQLKISGTVYKDSVTKQPADSVLVYTSSGEHTYTNRWGAYQIRMNKTDTLCVYYNGKVLCYYVFQSSLSNDHFDIYADDSTGAKQSFNQLKPVFVSTTDYKADSLQTRQEYEKIFNYSRSKISMGNNKWHDSIAVLGHKEAINTTNKKLSLLNVTSVAHAIHSKKSNRIVTLQKRLVETEQDNYVEHVFTPALVEKYSGMHDDDSLHLFIKNYAPAYHDLINMNELDIGMYIIGNIKVFRRKESE